MDNAAQSREADGGAIAVGAEHLPAPVQGRQRLGRWGEDVAAAFLAASGLRVHARNVRTRAGELDVICDDGEAWIFVEVKTRRGVGSGTPAEAVTPAKLARIRRLGLAWVRDAPGRRAGLRVDVVAIVINRDGSAALTHLRAVGY